MISDIHAMQVGLLQLRILVPDAMSLKDKRRAVKSLKDRIGNRFNVSVAETGLLDSLRQSGAHLAWRCSPVIDIGLDGQAIPCFPLAGVGKLEHAFEKTASEIQEFFHQKLRFYRIVGIYPDCSSCSLRVTESCPGGCLASALKRLRTDDFRYHFNPSFCS